MSLFDLEGLDPFYGKCVTLFNLYTTVRYGPGTNPLPYYLCSLGLWYERWIINPKEYPNKKPDPAELRYIVNAALFCVRSLLSEVRPTNTSTYGVITTSSFTKHSVLSKQNVENIVQATGYAIDLGLLPKKSGPDHYIKMLMNCFDEIINFVPYTDLDRKLQFSLVAGFYYVGPPKQLPLNTALVSDFEINNCDFYSNNIVPFYLNPESDPFLSPYDSDCYYDIATLSKNPFNRDTIISERILNNFSLSKKLRLERTRNLSLLRSNDQSPDLGFSVNERDIISVDVDYSVNDRLLVSTVLDLWLAGMYRHTREVISKSNKELLNNSYLSLITVSLPKGSMLIDKIYRDVGIMPRKI